MPVGSPAGEEVEVNEEGEPFVCVPATPVPPTAEDLERLRRVAEMPDDQIDYSDDGPNRGRWRGPIRQALLESVKPVGLTPYRLWQEAKKHRPELSKSQVYEYLRGKRELTAPALEALVLAAGLEVRPARRPASAEDV